MSIKHFPYFLIITLLSFFTQTAYSASSVWKVSKGNAYFYVGGTIHMLNASDHPLPDEFMKAYSDSDLLIFETDIQATKAPENQKKFMTAMSYSTNKTLSDDLKDDTYSRLAKFLTSRNIPVETFSRFQPWAVALTISVMEYQHLGMIPELGVDEFFYSKALTDKKAIEHLESIDEQLSFFSSMGKIDPNIMVEYTLRDLQLLPKFIGDIKKNWRTGDIEFFTTSPLISQMKTEFPDLYDTMIVIRNNAWMPKIQALLNNPKKAFVLVGTMHLNDKKGLLQQLKKAGFTVSQL